VLSDREKVCCVIEGSGPGIELGYLSQIFDSFFTTKTAGITWVTTEADVSD
jgi:C4-dicarboxylate-specific signal transduction histidine kinase